MATQNQTSVNYANASIAQTFTVSAPNGISGIYVRDIALFFSSVSSSFGVELQLVNLTRGLPDVSNPVLGASCRLLPSSVVASNTGTAQTVFSFNRLVFLQSDTTYAMVIKPLGATPDYEIWTAAAGDVDINTGSVVSANPASGSLYYAKNSNVWSEIPNEDLKYIIYRAQFNINNAAYAGLVKGNTEIFVLSNTSFLSGPVDIVAGDEVWGLTSNSQANTLVYAKVNKYDVTNQMMYCYNSTGNFANGQQIQVVRSSTERSLVGAYLQAISTISKVYDVRADGLIAKIGSPTDSLTGVSYQFLGVTKPNGTTPVLDSTWTTIPIQTEQHFTDATHFALSKSNEVSALGANSSTQLRVNMSSNTDYLSPIVDTKEHSLIVYSNQINSNTSGEYGDLGAALTRYISETIVLAEGMDAETMNVWIDAYKPVGTEVYVYAKIWNSEDPTSFDSELWTQLKQISNIGVFSDPKDTEDYREYAYTFDNATPSMTGIAWQPLNAGVPQTVQYQNGNGLFVGYKAFAIKIILAVDGTNTNLVPLLNDVRALALQL